MSLGKLTDEIKKQKSWIRIRSLMNEPHKISRRNQNLLSMKFILICILKHSKVSAVIANLNEIFSSQFWEILFNLRIYYENVHNTQL